MNHFLQRQARQQAERDFNRTYVACETGASFIKGYYAISFGAVNFENWPATLRLPRYPAPVTRIGRLAVDTRSQGQGVGKVLLNQAMTLAAFLAQQIGLFAVVVDATSEAGVAFYARYGFQRFSDRGLSLFLTLDVMRGALTLSRTQ